MSEDEMNRMRFQHDDQRLNAAPAKSMIRHPKDIVLEKPLFQIAIERILGRFGRLKEDAANQVLLLLQEGSHRDIPPAILNDIALRISKLMFPELYP
jgi:hypothetical protein